MCEDCLLSGSHEPIERACSCSSSSIILLGIITQEDFCTKCGHHYEILPTGALDGRQVPARNHSALP